MWEPLERGTVLPGSQHDGEPPTEVQFLQMPSQESLDAYVHDPRRAAMAAERGAAIARTDLLRIRRSHRVCPNGRRCRLAEAHPRSLERFQLRPFRVTAAAMET
jgi:hypothetical protein